MFAVLPSEEKQNFIVNDHELLAQHSFPHRKCPKFENTMDYVLAQLKTGENWTKPRRHFVNALSRGAHVAIAKCIGDSSGNPPLFMNDNAIANVPRSFIFYLKLKGFSLQQAVEIFQSFAEENQNCLQELRDKHPDLDWSDVPFQIKTCMDWYDVFHSGEWEAERKFLKEIMNEDIGRQE